MSATRAGDHRPRILHVVDTLGAGGLEGNMLVLIARTTDRFDHRVCCIRASGVLAEGLQALGIPIEVLGKRPSRDWSVAWRIARHCREVAPHIVHTRNRGTVDGLIGARLARVPVVIHSEHGFDSPEVPWRHRWLIWALSPLADRMLAVSEDLRRRLCTDFGVPAHKVKVARNGVDCLRFQPRTDGATLRRRHGYADTDVIVGVAARLDPMKNHVALVTAFARVAERRNDARLLVVGEGTERPSIEREIERLGLGSRVRLVGHQKDVEAWMTMFDLFAYAPLLEGMPNGVLEAMASGIPVVSTRVGGVPELVVDGLTGRLVSPGDIDALATAIEAYCSDATTRTAHGAAGRARVLKEFTPEGMVEAYSAAYEAMMASRGVLAPTAGNFQRS